MDTAKLMTLFAFIIFGIYVEHNAGIFTGQKTTGAYASVNSSGSSGADNQFMHRAIELSRNSIMSGHGHPLGSVVVKDGVIVGEGFGEVIMRNDSSAHAEFQAIRQAMKNLKSTSLKGCVVYSSTQPCMMCQNLISQAGISRSYYCIPAKLVQDEWQETIGGRLLTPQIQIMAVDIQKVLDSYIRGRNDARR
jgi:guanine deaminase